MNKSLLLSLLLLILLASCNQQAPYYTQDINIDIQIKAASYTYIRAEFEPDKDAFYYIGIIPWNTLNDVEYYLDTHFEVLTLDTANILYMRWRHELLKEKVPNIASFADHSLEYGKTEEYFNGLQKDSTYLIFAFAVDPNRLIPVSKVFYKTVTCNTLLNENVNFDAAINDCWDFVYPVDSNGQIVSCVPYLTLIASEGTILAEGMSGFTSPFLYFIFKMWDEYIYGSNDKFYYGISMRKHDNPLDSTNVFFQQDTTYYIGIGSTDAAFYERGITVYKFKYDGNNTKYNFYHDIDTIGVLDF